jgi:hypothetical protein
MNPYMEMGRTKDQRLASFVGMMCGGPGVYVVGQQAPVICGSILDGGRIYVMLRCGSRGPLPAATPLQLGSHFYRIYKNA